MFRDVNETIAGAAEAEHEELITLLCECADEFCVTELSLRRSAYERVRAVPEHFAVAPDHVEQRFERVVERYPHYWVVEKVGAAGEVAKETDPRSDGSG